MALTTDDVIQWIGAPLVIGGHALNAIGPSVYPWNVVVFFGGTTCFLIWAIRARNTPQSMVNLITFAIGLMGLIKAFFG